MISKCMLKHIKGFFDSKPQTLNNNDICVVWIHGANQSPLSFSYLKSKTQFTNNLDISYSSMNRFYHNLSEIIEVVKPLGKVFVVGHSLGGLYGLHLTQHCDVVGGVSLSTPFRGSSTADWAKYIVPSYPLFKDIGRKSAPVVDSYKFKLTIPWTQVISTAGTVPYHNGPNDGVVTVASMEHRSDMEKIHVNHTHYEVVCSPDIADLIVNRYNRVI